MQQILNALFIILIGAANQQKPVHYSVRKYGDTYIEFHSGYVLKLEEGYVTITDGERKTKVRARLAVDGKMSPEFMNVLKDLLNKDFNSGIEIDEPKRDEENIGGAEVDDSNDKSDNEGEEDTADKDDNTSEAASGTDEEKKASQRKIPGRAESEKKKK